MTRSSTDNRKAPVYRTSAWNSRMSHLAPSDDFARSRSSRIVIMPTWYASAWPGATR